MGVGVGMTVYSIFKYKPDQKRTNLTYTERRSYLRHFYTEINNSIDGQWIQ